MSAHLNTIKNNYIRYANCWEDADLLLKALNIQNGDKVLSIGSAGDNSFSLLAGKPELVVAVDINPVQLKLIELKKAAILTLNYNEFIEFLGFKPSENRLSLFKRVCFNLSKEDRIFWCDRYNEIKEGIIYQGKFENYFKLFRKKILPFIHQKKNIDSLFQEKSAVEQNEFFLKKWNSWRWRALFRIFFSKFIMGKFGRDPKFLEEVNVTVSDFILNKAKRHLSSKGCQTNYFLDFIMRGKFNIDLPHYARQENFKLIKENINKLIVFQGYASEVFVKHKGFNKFNLSNIFEYMDADTFQSIGMEFIENGVSGAKYAYWNLMVPRSLSDVGMQVDDISFDQYQDKGFFYSSFHLNQKK